MALNSLVYACILLPFPLRSAVGLAPFIEDPYSTISGTAGSIWLHELEKKNITNIGGMLDGSYIPNELLHRRLNCDSFPYHPLAKKGNDETDIYLDTDTAAKDAAKALAIPVYNEAREYVLNKKSSRMAGEMAALDPTWSNCTWLRLQHFERAGLGHTFDGWSFYLRFAIEHKITLWAPFFSTEHGVCNLNETTSYFGFHSVFYWARSPPADAKLIEIEKDTGDCNSDAIEKAMRDYLKSNNKTAYSCSDGHVVFKCYNRGIHFFKRLAGSINGLEVPARGVFWSAYSRYSKLHMPPQVKAARDAGNITVTVHMRRGDVLWGRVDRDHRLVSYGVYVRMIRELLQVRAISPNSSHPLKVFFLCEGAQNDYSIMEFDAGNLHHLYPINVTTHLGDACNETNACSMEVLWKADLLQSFTAMCDSDVLITSTSGYPFVASALCEPKLTLAIHFSSNYDAIRNVVHVNRMDALWKWDAQVKLDGLQEKWQFVVNSGPAFVDGQRVSIPDPTQTPTAAPTYMEVKENMLVRSARGKQVYIFRDGQLHAIPDMATFSAMGLDFKDVKPLPDDQMSRLKIGSAIPVGGR